ncbi:hypothetical protein [Bacillus sp. REN3]|uniref:hypothetical protein n=1 Tax=Bacillus sp. REN3 TaxID=2802440 RepID=UPI001AEE3972|nr:hypothetical protein [Bacillus sp. REN3]
MEYWKILQNPTDKTYEQLMNVLCRCSDQFYFVTRKELSYNQGTLGLFMPFMIQTFKTKKWANTITKGPAAQVYVFAANKETCILLKQAANSLYDWVAPKLPEDLTFMKNNTILFTSTTHEENSGFSIRSEEERKLIGQIDGLKVQKFL